MVLENVVKDYSVTCYVRISMILSSVFPITLWLKLNKCKMFYSEYLDKTLILNRLLHVVVC